MLTKEEWLETVFANSPGYTPTPADLAQLDADWARYEQRMRDPEAFEAAKVKAQDECVRKHAEELAATYGAPGAADAIESWLNATDDEGGLLIIDGDLSKMEDEDG